MKGKVKGSNKRSERESDEKNYKRLLHDVYIREPLGHITPVYSLRFNDKKSRRSCNRSVRGQGIYKERSVSLV